MAKKANKAQTKKAPTGYTMGSWAGQPHYECDYCAFDSLDRSAMLEHLLNVHNSEQALEALIEKEQAAEAPAAETEANPNPATTQEIHGLDLKEDQP